MSIIMTRKSREKLIADLEHEYNRKLDEVAEASALVEADNLVVSIETIDCQKSYLRYQGEEFPVHLIRSINITDKGAAPEPPEWKVTYQESWWEVKPAKEALIKIEYLDYRPAHIHCDRHLAPHLLGKLRGARREAIARMDYPLVDTKHG